MAKKLKITDYIYYGVKLKVVSITEIELNRIRVEFKPTNCDTDELRDLKNLTLVYIGQRANRGLFNFSYQTNNHIQTYALTLKKRIGTNTYQTSRVFVEKRKATAKELVYC